MSVDLINNINATFECIMHENKEMKKNMDIHLEVLKSYHKEIKECLKKIDEKKHKIESELKGL